MCDKINSQRQHKIEDNNSNNLLKHNFVKPVTNKKVQHTYLSLSLFFLNKHSMFYYVMMIISITWDKNGPHSGRLRLITGPSVMKLPLETDLRSDTSKSDFHFIVLFSIHINHISATMGQLLPTQCNISDRQNHRYRITRTDSSRFLVNYGLWVAFSGSPLILAKTKITKSTKWNLWGSSAYFNSIGRRIPVGCVYAARPATIEDTEGMSLVFFLIIWELSKW